MFDWLIKFIQAEIDLFSINRLEKKGEITQTELKELFKEDSKTINLTPLKIYTLDRKYNLTDLKNLNKFLFKYLTDAKSYEEETYDCDDFAIKLWAKFKSFYPNYALGLALSNSHVFNIFIDDKKKIWVIEPQNDQVMDYENITSKYKLKMIII